MKFLRRVFVLVVLVWVVAVVALVALAYEDASAGREALLGAQKSATSGGLRGGATESDLRKASSRLHRAHRSLTNPVLEPFTHVPVVGRQLLSAAALTDAGDRTAAATLNALTRGRTLADENKTDRQKLLQELSVIADETTAKLNAVTFGPNKGLLSPLANARNKATLNVAQMKEGLARGSAGARGAAELFNREGTYLVVAANNAEMRAGSGMFLSVGTMKTGNGTLQLSEMESVSDAIAPKGSVKWPQELQDRWGWMNYQYDFRNVMLSPRFDVGAPLAKQIWEKGGHKAVDGVLVIDPDTLRAMLAATGPVKSGGKTITSANVLSELMFEQYKELETGGTQTSRRENLSGVAAAAFVALNEGRWDPIVLARELGRAASSRHILLWSKDQKLNDEWKTAGVAGELTPDSMLPALINVGGNKFDQFVHVDATAERAAIGDRADFTVVAKITNETPTDLPKYTLGAPNNGLEPGEYEALLSFNVPGDATSVRFDNDPDLVASGADGPTQVIATRIKVKRGETQSFTLRFSRASNAAPVIVEPSARIPALKWHYKNLVWNDIRRRALLP